MPYSINSAELISAIELSFREYKIHGARSTAKLRPIHRFVANTLLSIFGKGFEVKFLDNKELKVDGKYYPKKVDVTITKDRRPIFCVGIKFVMSNIDQNKNNYFENMMGETANIQANKIPYAQLIILRQPTPYFKKNGVKTKDEWINDNHIQKYLNLAADKKRVDVPYCLGIQLVHIDEASGAVSLDIENRFSQQSQILIKKLSLEKFFDKVEQFRAKI